MTDNDRTEVFLYSLTLLKFGDDALTDDNDLADIETIARLCVDIKAITAGRGAPEQKALHRLAVRTEDMLCTWVFPDEHAVRAWLIARGEFLQIRLAAIR